MSAEDGSVPGHYPHKPPKLVPAHSTLEIENGWDTSYYRIWWHPECPIHILGYGSNRPLWRESERGNWPWRASLYEDIKVRGQINPILVWNHRDTWGSPKAWEMYVKVGRNKCWAMRALEARVCKALFASDERPIPGAIEIGPVSILDYFKDGHLEILKRGLLSHGCTDPARNEMPLIDTGE